MSRSSSLRGLLVWALAPTLLLSIVVPAPAQATEVTFRLSAPDAQSVYLAGEFNNWNPQGQRMEDPDGDGIFETILELSPGRYAYKYVIDGNWKEDPSASEFVDDGFGGKNSVVVVGDTAMVIGPATGSTTPKAAPTADTGKSPVTFSVEAPGAGSVYLAGEFNNWSDSAQKMTDADGDGIFDTTIQLAVGRYAYKFVIDGNWKEDPKASEFVDDGFGGKNSVVAVGERAAGVTAAGGAAAGTTAGKRPVRFVCEASPGAQVFLAGEFNSWNPQAEQMTDEDGDGTFETVLELAPGRYAYKFVIDGNWKEDPKASEFVDDGFGGKNSVVNVSAGEGILEIGEAGAGSAAGGAAAGAGSSAAAEEATKGVRSVTFTYQPVISGVKDVFLAGTFNDWNVGATAMSDSDGDGIYEVTLLLAPGQYQYKFVVDGNWITDDKADAFADDGFGGKNSVIRVDARYETIDVTVGDGKFYLENLDLRVDYATVNEIEPNVVQFRARAYHGDIESLELLYRQQGKPVQREPMSLELKDAVFSTYTTTVFFEQSPQCRFTFAYHDGDQVRYALAEGGFADEEPKPEQWGLYTHEVLPPFRVPEWAQTAVYYQIFPDRFANGDPSNDPDFSEPYYDGRKTLPENGKINGEYFHFVEDWNDVAGLQVSPYRTDGKPDYYSFYGGDIQGVMDRLEYLAEVGVTVIYFNPVTEGRSNHRYDPCDYQKLDPHLGTEELFKDFTAKALDEGIRVIVDMAYNHTGDCHFAFQDVITNWKDSEYFDWYEWKQRPPSWPLPPGANALDYYDCWWGFGLHPNLNFDLSRPNDQENGISELSEADPNWNVVNYLLDSVNYWMGDLGCSGFRLDVPNEVPFWFWKLFRERCNEVRPEHVLIGEIWGDAGSWIGPDVFDAVMNYRYYKDPVVKWIGQRNGNAATFDQELAPGRMRYPLQAVRAQMNLVDSHDTVRFLQVAGGDVRRLQLAATFGMTYVGAPHIYYGDEVALTGGKDPDSRRTFPWDQLDAPARARTHEHFQTVAALRHQYPALSKGSFATVLAKGDLYAYLREHRGERILVVLNNGNSSGTALLPIGNAGVADGTSVNILLGDETTLVGEDQTKLEVRRGVLRVTVPAVSGAIFELD